MSELKENDWFRTGIFAFFDFDITRLQNASATDNVVGKLGSVQFVLVPKQAVFLDECEFLPTSSNM